MAWAKGGKHGAELAWHRPANPSCVTLRHDNHDTCDTCDTCDTYDTTTAAAPAVTVAVVTRAMTVAGALPPTNLLTCLNCATSLPGVNVTTV